jgi:4-diphosphocytidyl-2-C-methyl-D-erythritol kinase
MRSCRALAPAKINLGLFLGPTRTQDGRHELVTVMQSVSLADELTLELAPEGTPEDEVLCPPVPGLPAENLAGAALRTFRESTGWEVPSLRLSIAKRIPVAAGMGGGSADAAAALRLARYASGIGDEELLRELGAALGADVPAQISPGCWLASGAGERLDALPQPSLVALVLPVDAELATSAVYAEADRLGLGRPREELAERHLELRAAWSAPARERGAVPPVAGELFHNDLQEAALALCPEIAHALSEAREAGAQLALVSGSGPTVVGLFPEDRSSDARGRSGDPSPPGESDGADARLAAGRLARRRPAPIYARPVEAGFGGAAELREGIIGRRRDIELGRGGRQRRT